MLDYLDRYTTIQNKTKTGSDTVTVLESLRGALMVDRIVLDSRSDKVGAVLDNSLPAAMITACLYVYTKSIETERGKATGKI